VIGNCISACVASILEIPIEGVPFFFDEHWWPRFLEWLGDRGFTATAIAGDVTPPPGFTMALGPSTRLESSGHACVAFDGVVVHDPHPSREGLPFVHYYVLIHSMLIR
jgi:hypothetical protein